MRIQSRVPYSLGWVAGKIANPELQKPTSVTESLCTFLPKSSVSSAKGERSTYLVLLFQSTMSTSTFSSSCIIRLCTSAVGNLRSNRPRRTCLYQNTWKMIGNLKEEAFILSDCFFYFNLKLTWNRDLIRFLRQKFN